MRLILSSCDFGHPKSADFIKENLCKSLADCKVLFIPNEKATPEKIKSGKYESRLSAFGFQKKNIYVFDAAEPDKFLNLELDMIYVSGGNTFGTLKKIRDAGFADAIVDYVHSGVVYVGGSAGAHIATANIAHVSKYDVDTCDLCDFSGLGLYSGILICHYSDARKQDLEQLQTEGRYHVKALRDEDSVLIREE